MERFVAHTGIGVPLRRSNVDTDQILPARFLKRITRSGHEDALFAAWREDPAFVLNRAPFDRGSVLVAGPDFGTGSSREMAVWALQDYGFRVVVAARFGDIFRGNSGKAGLLLVQIPEADVETLQSLLESAPGLEVTADLQALMLTADGFAAPFTLDEYTRWRMLEGLDDIAITLESEAAIRAFEAIRPAFRPALGSAA